MYKHLQHKIIIIKAALKHSQIRRQSEDEGRISLPHHFLYEPLLIMSDMYWGTGPPTQV